MQRWDLSPRADAWIEDLMRNFLLAAVLICSVAGLEAQRRGAGGAVTLAIAVADPDGKPIPDVVVVVEGVKPT